MIDLQLYNAILLQYFHNYHDSIVIKNAESVIDAAVINKDLYF